MQFRVLGRFEVSRDGVVVDAGTFRQKSLLAFLLTNPNTIVSTDRIMDALWGEEAASDRQNALWVHISGLRTALEPGREKRSEGTILLTKAPGYLLQVDLEDVDALQFERMAAEGRALAEADPAAASLVLSEALALWRGRAYEDFTYEPFAAAEISRLEELRLETVEARIKADLRRGMSHELVSELESLIRQHPLREGLVGQAMLALYRSGRQAEALRLYQFLKSRLGEELGIEPSLGVRKLEEQIVTGDPALEPATALQPPGSGPEPGLAIRGYELREKLGEGGFGVVYRAYQPAVGREVAIKVIRPELANDPAFVRRFEAEAQLVARLEHPHIVPLYDYWREPGAAYLVMRLMGRGSLRDVVDSTALTPDDAVKVVEQISGALLTAHRAGVAHGDIKPENILIDGAGNAFLSDFAIALGAGHSVDDGRPDRTLGSPFASPEQQADGSASPAGDIHSMGVVMAQALTGLTGEPSQIRGALPPAIARVIDRATDPDPDARYADVVAFARDLLKELAGRDRPAEQAIALGPVENPYKGLRPFDQSDEATFFGRDRLIARLVNRLGQGGPRSRFVAVVGPSGSGKSSVVKAGLLPALRKGALPASDEWFVVEMTPAPHPFEELESALSRMAVDPTTTLLERLAGSESGLRRTVRDLLPAGSQLLLVVDQFEELFTQVDDETAGRFIDALVDAVSHTHANIRVVATLRADFYDRPLRHRGLGELLREGTEVITPMSPEELEQAITRPAGALGVTFEPSLVAELVRDVADRAGALPLLQYTLTELFEGRSSATVPLADYRAVGGVSGALVARADGLLAGMSPMAADAARQVFLRLVTLGEGTEDTRRRVLVAELHQLPAASQDLDHVLETFGRHRLVSFDRDPVTRGPTAEISHEALLTQWRRLRDWIDEARHDIRNQRRLAQAMDEWVGAGRGDDYLLRGGRLDQLSGWVATTTLPLSSPEREFLDASLAERERAEGEEREREKRAEDAERRERNRARQLGVVGVAAALVAVSAIFAVLQWTAARGAEAETAMLLRASSLATAANLSLDADPELSLLVAVEAIRITADEGFVTPEALDALHWAIQANAVIYPADSDTPVAVRSGPRGAAGVFALPPSVLAATAVDATDRVFLPNECVALFPEEPCPDPREPLPRDLSVLGGDDAYGVVQNIPGALAGTTLDVLGAWNVDDLASEWARFEAENGITVSYSSGNVGAELSRQQAKGVPLPDAAITPQPGSVISYARTGLFVDLSSILDIAEMRSQLGSYLMDFVTVAKDGTWPASSGSVYSVPIDVDLKGLVFYPRAAFESAGYVVPETWDELMDLSQRMVADERAPWCIGFGAERATGWPGTDWIESLVLREAGPEVYDDWSTHRIPFDNEAVQSAARRFDEIVSNPGFVWQGKGRISDIHFGEGALALEQDEPSCWLYHQADFVLGGFSAGTELGRDIDFFVLPPIDPGRVTPAYGGGNFVGAFGDRPELRVLLEYLASPRWGEIWARSAESEFISPNALFDVDQYGADASESESDVRTELGIIARDAIAAGVWRFDASDVMPREIGAFDGEQLGAFWQGMVDYVDGVRTMDQVLSDIEAAWVALEVAEGG
jgi:serine/threonine protein kinase/DNA-binding SARP family transcriptional activator/ABC-type glycerol-3-phosphate transport system substrate-binding protein